MPTCPKCSAEVLASDDRCMECDAWLSSSEILGTTAKATPEPDLADDDRWWRESDRAEAPLVPLTVPELALQRADDLNTWGLLTLVASLLMGAWVAITGELSSIAIMAGVWIALGGVIWWRLMEAASSALACLAVMAEKADGEKG